MGNHQKPDVNGNNTFTELLEICIKIVFWRRNRCYIGLLFPIIDKSDFID